MIEATLKFENEAQKEEILSILTDDGIIHLDGVFNTVERTGDTLFFTKQDTLFFTNQQEVVAEATNFSDVEGSPEITPNARTDEEQQERDKRKGREGGGRGFSDFENEIMLTPEAAQGFIDDVTEVKELLDEPVDTENFNQEHGENHEPQSEVN